MNNANAKNTVCTSTLPLSHDSWQLLFKDIYLLTAKRLSGPIKPQKKGCLWETSYFHQFLKLDAWTLFVVLGVGSLCTLNIIIAVQSHLCIQQTGCINRQSAFFGWVWAQHAFPKQLFLCYFLSCISKEAQPYKLLANTTKIFIFIIWWYKHPFHLVQCIQICMIRNHHAMV